MKNLSVHTPKPVALTRRKTVVGAAALLFAVCCMAASVFAQGTPPEPWDPVFADTIYVGKDGDGEFGTGTSNNRYLTIDSAMNHVNGTFLTTLVLVGPGIYEESVWMPYGATTWIRSEQGPAATTIRGTGSTTIILNSDSDDLFSGIQGFTIAGNTVDGCVGFCAGAIQADAVFGNQFFILDNWIMDNSGEYLAGAIAIEYPMQAFIIGNKIIGNAIPGIDTFGAGAIWYNGYYGVIANNIIADNYGPNAGGLYAYGSADVTVSNNTFAENNWDNSNGQFNGAGAVYLEVNTGKRVSSPQAPLMAFNNNIVAGNMGPAIDATDPIALELHGNLFFDNGVGDPGQEHYTSRIPVAFDNLVDEDPLFVDAASKDYHIICASPARDAGANDFLPSDSLARVSDIDGPPQRRIAPGAVAIVDIGADEFNDTDKIAAFTTPDTVGCAPLTVHFVNESECIDEEWGWYFGDGTAPLIGTEPEKKSPTHVYADTGLYTVQLDAVGDLDMDTVIKTNYIRVLPPLIIDFTGDDTTGCGSVTTLFTASASAEVDLFTWFFGDGDSAVTMTDTITHAYTSAGTFTVTLRAANVCANVERTRSGYVTTLSDAEVSITSDYDHENPPCVPAPVAFTYDSDQILTDLMWEFGDDSTSTEANPTHTYTEPGVFDVTFSATSDCGAVSVDSIDYITILGFPGVSVGATPTSGCEGELLVEFSATITGTADSSRWHFGDGSTGLGPNALYSYVSAGPFEPFLVVFLHPCGVDTFPLVTSITTTPAPVANFFAIPLDLYETEIVEFTDASQNSPDTYEWDFGDDSDGSTLKNPEHEYDPGVYTVALKVTNGCGSDTETKTNYIRVGSFTVTCDSSGTSGDDILYTVDVDSLVIGYDHTVVLTAELVGTPARGSVVFAFDDPSGVPPFTTTLRATPTGGLSTGNYTIRIVADDALRMQKTSFCPLSYTAEQIISVSQSLIDFGELIINTDDTSTVFVTNTATPESGATLAVEAPSTSGTGFSVEGVGGVLQPGGVLPWIVTFMPTQVGSFTGILNVDSDDPVAPAIDVTLTGNGIPVPDTIPPCVDFTDPEDNTEIAIDSVVRITFTEGMVPPTGQSLQLISSSGPVTGATAWETKRRVRFTPSGFLPSDDIITVTVFATLTDSASHTLDGDCDSTALGSPADDYTFDFTTGPGVFPGDTDNDGFVNEGDIIPLGRFWQQTGPERSNPQPGLTIQPATAWTPRAATYADADGDGVVDSMDICPVIDFFDQPTGMARTSVQQWMTDAQGWSEDVVAALLAALDICDGEGPGNAAVGQFLHSLQASNDPVPNDYALHQNYPNPFNPSTIIAYTLKQDAHVRLEVFDVQGRLVRVLEDNFQTVGRHHLIWDSRDADDQPVASGIYFYRLTTPDFRLSRKMVLVR